MVQESTQKLQYRPTLFLQGPHQPPADPGALPPAPPDVYGQPEATINDSNRTNHR